MKLPSSDYYELEKLEIAKIIRDGLKEKKNKDVSDIKELNALITKLKGLKLSDFDEAKLKKLAEKHEKRLEAADFESMSFMQRIVNLINYFEENGGDRNKTLKELFENKLLLSRSVARKKDFIEKFKDEFGFKLLTLLTAYVDSKGYIKRRYFMQVLKLFFKEDGSWTDGSQPYRNALYEGLKNGFFNIGKDELGPVSVGEVFPSIVYNYIRVLCSNSVNNKNFICRDELKKGLNDSMNNGFFSSLYDVPFSINSLGNKNLVVSAESIVDSLNAKVKELFCFIFAYYPRIQDLKSEDFLTDDDAFNKKFLNKFDNFFKGFQKELFDDFVKRSDYKSLSKEELKSDTYLSSLIQELNFSLSDTNLGKVENRELSEHYKNFSSIDAFKQYSYNESDRTNINNFFTSIRDKAKKSNKDKMEEYYEKFKSIIKTCNHADKIILVREFWKQADNLANINDFKSFYNLVVDLFDLNEETLKELKKEFEKKKKEYEDLKTKIINPLTENLKQVSLNLKKVKIDEDVEPLFKNLVIKLFDSAGYSSLDFFEKSFNEKFERFTKLIEEKEKSGTETLSDLTKKSWNAFKKEVDDFGLVSENKAEQLFDIFKKMNETSQSLKMPVTELPDLPSKDASRNNFINALKKEFTPEEKPVIKKPFISEKEDFKTLLVVNTNFLISSIVDSFAEKIDEIDLNSLDDYALIGKLLFKSFLKIDDNNKVDFKNDEKQANDKYYSFKQIFNNLKALEEFAINSLEVEA